MGTPPVLSMGTFATIVRAVDAENPDRPNIGTLLILVEENAPPTIMSNFPNVDDVLLWLIAHRNRSFMEEHPIPERQDS